MRVEICFKEGGALRCLVAITEFDQDFRAILPGKAEMFAGGLLKMTAPAGGDGRAGAVEENSSNPRSLKTFSYAG